MYVNIKLLLNRRGIRNETKHNCSYISTRLRPEASRKLENSIEDILCMVGIVNTSIALCI